MSAANRIFSVESFIDERGTLVPFDCDTIPFVPLRTFFIYDVPRGAVRGGHTLNCDEVIWSLSSSCVLDIDENGNHSSIRLFSRDKAVLIPSGSAVELRDFEPETVLVVLCSRSYSEAGGGPLKGGGIGNHDPASRPEEAF